MKNNDSTAAPASAPAEVFQQLGQITRQLHDGMNQLGVLLVLRHSASGLPDARSRLQFVADKTGEAADKVLTAVESAKEQCAELSDEARRAAESGGAAAELSARVKSRLAIIDGQLTDIMLAQDFHDLTGQVVSKVVALATDLEDSLLKLLVSTAGVDSSAGAKCDGLQGPVLPGCGRTDVVHDQGEVDELLASLGF